MTTPVADRLRTPGRWTLGVVLLVAGLGHLTTQREEFQAQVPSWFPVDADTVVVASGVVEILFGGALLSGRRRVAVGWLVAAFFVMIFPGNIAQFVEGKDGFGLRKIQSTVDSVREGLELVQLIINEVAEALVPA